MDTVVKQNKHGELQSKVKNFLADYYEMDRIKLEELMAILKIMGNAQSYEELKSYLVAFSNSFPVLKDVLENEERDVRSDIEFSVSDIVGKILPIDPNLASTVARFAADRHVSFEEIVQAYPEVNKYMN